MLTDDPLLRQVIEGRLTPQPGDPNAAWEDVRGFFLAIAARVGLDKAREMFSAFGRPPRKQEYRQADNEDLIELYNLDGQGSVWKFAERVAKMNSTLPPKRRLGPRGSTSQATIYKHLNRLLKKAGLWTLR